MRAQDLALLLCFFIGMVLGFILFLDTPASERGETPTTSIASEEARNG